jgi:hypothetical protein
MPDSSTRTPWELSTEIPSSDAGKTWREMDVDFPDEISLHTPQGF